MNKTQQIMYEIINIFEKNEVPTDSACKILLNIVKMIIMCEEGEMLCKK